MFLFVTTEGTNIFVTTDGTFCFVTTEGTILFCNDAFDDWLQQHLGDTGGVSAWFRDVCGRMYALAA